MWEIIDSGQEWEKGMAVMAPLEKENLQIGITD